MVGRVEDGRAIRPVSYLECKKMSLRDKVRQLVETRAFERFIIAVIVINAIGLGLQSNPSWRW